MSRYAQFDEDGNQYQFASNTGWSEFGSWIESLDKSKYPALADLWEYGSTQDIQGVTDQIDSALRDSPPSKNVESSAELLLSGLCQNENAHTLLITS